MKKKKHTSLKSVTVIFFSIRFHHIGKRVKKKKNVNKINAVRARWHEGTDIFGCHFVIVA